MPRSSDNQKAKVKVYCRIDPELKEWGIKNGINFSRSLEEKLREEKEMLSNADHGQLMQQIHQGNVGARKLVLRIMGDFSLPDSEEIFNQIIKRGQTGAKLWVLFKDTHQENFEDFIADLQG